MCGLMGYSGRAPFNFTVGKLITILQEDRGRTSVGFLIGKYHYKDMGAPDAFFKTWMFDYPKKANIAFIHNRMPSKGLSTKVNAHPFNYKFQDANDNEQNAYFAHNGTLTNCDELCEKYNIDKNKFDTDSELLGYIITHFGFDVLSEYKGAAAFFYTREDQPDVLYVWKGASRQTLETIEEERPLYYANIKGGVYFASTEAALRTALDLNKANPAICFPDNNLIAFQHGSIISQQVFDRSHIEKRPVQQQGYSNYNRGQGGSQAPFTTTVNKSTAKTGVENVLGKHKKLENKITYGSENPEPDRRKLYEDCAIYYQCGRYYSNGKPLNGEVRIDVSQCVLSDDLYTFWSITEDGIDKHKAWYHGQDDGLNFEIDCDILYFHNGVWLKDSKSLVGFRAVNNDKTEYENEISYKQKCFLHPDSNHFIFSKQGYNTICFYKGSDVAYTGVVKIRDKFSLFEYTVDIAAGKYYAVLKIDLETDPAIENSKPDSSILTSKVNNLLGSGSDMTRDEWADQMSFIESNIGTKGAGNILSKSQVTSELDEDVEMLSEYINNIYRDYIQALEDDFSSYENEKLDILKAFRLLLQRKDLVKRVLEEAPF